MPVAVDVLQTKGSQGRITSRYAPIHNGVNRNYAFTAKEVLCFLKLEGLVEVVKTIDVVTDADIESLVKPGGFTRPRVEDKMVETAFKVLAPGLPKIPPDNVVKMLEFSKAKRLGAAYKIQSKISWSKLKNDLDMKRAEILRAYSKYLIAGGRYEQYVVNHVRATSHQFTITIKYRMDANAPPCSKSRNTVTVARCTSSMEVMEDRSTSATVSKDQVEGYHSIPIELNDSSGQCTRRRISEMGQTKIPCYVTTRKKRGFKRQEIQQNVHALGNISRMAGNLSKRKVGRDSSTSQNRGIGQTDGRIDQSFLMPDRNEGDVEGSAPRLVGSECRKHETMSVRTDILDAFQLAQSPVGFPEQEEFGFSDEDDWTDEASPAERSGTFAEDSAKCGPVESPTTVTLRKLAELREQILEEKRTGVWQQRIRLRQQQRDFMNSPDSDYTFSDACRSPRPPQQCTFAFRGLRVEAPAAAERPSRQRHPAWYVREDPGSPTPMRVALRRR
ncbi:hypothetical protein ACEPAF_5517 [Sanghuangporus sanghuang]